MNIPFMTNYFTKKTFEKEISENEIKLLRQKADIQKTILDQKQEIQKSLINITEPKQALSPELYLNNQLYTSTYNNPAYSSGFWGFDNTTLRRTSRIAYWESTTGRSIINRFVDVVVGAKLDLQAEPIWDIIENGNSGNLDEHKKWTKKTEARFKNWAKNKNIDYIQERNLYQLMRQTFFYLLRDGEYFIIYRYNFNQNSNPLTLQIIPPENIKGGEAKAGNTLINGIEYKKDRAVAYHIYDELTGKTQRVIAKGPKSGRTFVVHVYLKDNEKQRRGIPILSTVLPELTKLADYQLMELQAALINALFAVWIQPPKDEDGRTTIPKAGISKSNQYATQSTQITDWQSDIDTMDFKNGGYIVENVPAGHEIKSFDTKRPHAGFPEFSQQVKLNISASLNIPLSVVDFRFSQSYSGARGELITFWNTVNRMRMDHGWNFCDPVYLSWMWGEVDNGKIQAPGWNEPEKKSAWINAKWIGNQRPDIDPFKSVKANELEHRNGYKTGAQIAAERGGGDYTENLEKITGEFSDLSTAIEKFMQIIKGKTTL